MSKISVISRKLCLLFAIGIGSLASQASEPPTDEEAQNVSQRGHERMVRLLQRIAIEGDFTQDNFLNTTHARFLETQSLPSNLRERVALEFNLARQLLFAGESQKAIDLLQQIVQTSEQQPERFSEKFLRNLKSHLALGYLRLGEQDNCVERHNPKTCIFPIAEGGVHTVQRGSRAAIPIYKGLLESDPNDLNARWLLNLAYMTLGEYPAKVPEKWLLKPELFASTQDFPLFEDVAMQTGSAINELAGGVSAADFNGDGLVDLIVSSWNIDSQLLYLEREAGGGFVDRTREAGLQGITGGLNLIHGDYDNDGKLDVFVLRGAWRNQGGLHPNSLLRNTGGSFEDVTEASGLLAFSPTQTASWADYDLDGDLDLFVGGESSGKLYHPSKLYQNRGNGTFEDVTMAAGIQEAGYIKAVVWGDIDNDQRPDIYISRMDGRNSLLRNLGPVGESGTWRFENITQKAGVGEPAVSFPAWIFDYDNDGYEDIFVSGYGRSYESTAADAVVADYLGETQKAEIPRLYRNRGDLTFEDVTEQVGLDRFALTMGCNFGDIDGDGWLDFYLGTGAPDFQALVPNLMFRNDRGQRFQDITTAGGFGHLQKGHGIAFADFDLDGDQDVYAVMGGAYSGDIYPNVLFENPGSDNRWIQLSLIGKQSARDGTGARVQVRTVTQNGSRDIYRTVNSGGSFGANPLVLNIGLGKADSIAWLDITWPVSGKQRVTIAEMNAVYRIEEGSPAVKTPHKKEPFPQGEMDHHGH